MVTWRLALRNLSTNRLRTAITLLALSAGMFALSSITFVGEGTRELLNLQLSRTFGGNVLVFPFPGLPASLVKNGDRRRPGRHRNQVQYPHQELRDTGSRPQRRHR